MVVMPQSLKLAIKHCSSGQRWGVPFSHSATQHCDEVLAQVCQFYRGAS